MDCTNKKQLEIIYGDVTLGIKGSHNGKDFHYIFSYAVGGPESLVVEGKEWIYRSPKPTFWRALTDNDRGSKFHIRSGMWLSTDMFLNCVQITGFSYHLVIVTLRNCTSLPSLCRPM